MNTGILNRAVNAFSAVLDGSFMKTDPETDISNVYKWYHFVN